MKKVLIILMLVLMCLTMCACGSKMAGSYKFTCYKIDKNETITKDIKKIYEKYNLPYGILDVDNDVAFGLCKGWWKYEIFI